MDTLALTSHGTSLYSSGVVEVKLERPEIPECFSGPKAPLPGPLTLHVEVEGQAVSGTPLVSDLTVVRADFNALWWAYESWQPRTVA